MEWLWYGEWPSTAGVDCPGSYQFLSARHRDILSWVECRAAVKAFCGFWLFLRFPWWTLWGRHRGSGRRGVGVGEVAGMHGISDCPPLSLCLPAVLPGKWEGCLARHTRGLGPRIHTHMCAPTHTQTYQMCQMCSWSAHQPGRGGGDIKG